MLERCDPQLLSPRALVHPKLQVSFLLKLCPPDLSTECNDSNLHMPSRPLAPEDSEGKPLSPGEIRPPLTPYQFSACSPISTLDHIRVQVGAVDLEHLLLLDFVIDVPHHAGLGVFQPIHSTKCRC